MKLYYYIILLPITLALKVYQSNLSIINDKDTSGLHFQPQEYKSFHTKHSFSGCIRFNYKRLYKTVVLLISDANCSICTSDPSHPFFNLVAEYPNHLSFWGIGRYDLPGEPWASYLTNTPWITGIWNHLCMAYNKVSSHISVVKVCISNDKRNCQWILSCEPNQCCMFPIHSTDLGIYLKEKGYDNWILRELPDNFIVWTTNKWHHVCLSYSKVNSRIIVVKVQISLFNYMPILTYFVSGWKGY